MSVCFLVLAHQHPLQVARLVNRLREQGACVALHIDRKVNVDFHQQLRERLHDQGRDLIWAKPVSVAWGTWSLVEATLNGLGGIADSGQTFDYVYLISGADYPIAPVGDVEAFLHRNAGHEFIESVDAERERWVTRGFQCERYAYRHWVSYRKSPRFHLWSVAFQQRFGLTRRFPEGYRPHLGSQWWALTWSTCQAILERAADPRLKAFFRTTAIPDELFFQTMVRSVVTDQTLIDGRHLTLYEFSDEGAPVVYYNGHERYLLRQPFFFARKLSPFADRLRDEIDRAVDLGETDGLHSDSDIGRRSLDYQRFVLTHQNGLFGRRSMGRVRDAWYGDLERSSKLYFALIGDAPAALAGLKEQLTQQQGLLCHGELFAPSEIDFVDGESRWAGYAKTDLSLRDHKPQNFLADIVAERADVLPGFVLNLQSSGKTAGEHHGVSALIGDVVAWDHNCICIFLCTDPVDRFFDELGDDAFAGAEGSLGPELFASFYRRHLAADRLARLRLAAKESGAPSLVATTLPGGQGLTDQDIESILKLLSEQCRKVLDAEDALRRTQLAQLDPNEDRERLRRASMPRSVQWVGCHAGMSGIHDGHVQATALLSGVSNRDDDPSDFSAREPASVGKARRALRACL